MGNERRYSGAEVEDALGCTIGRLEVGHLYDTVSLCSIDRGGEEGQEGHG